MKDNLLLLFTAIVCAILAWVFFVYFQNYAFTILLLIFVIAVLAKPVKSKFGHSKKKPNK